MKKITALVLLLLMAGCGINANDVLAGASHACGTVYVEGYFTDSRGEIVVAKAPDSWTPEMIAQFCAQN